MFIDSRSIKKGDPVLAATVIYLIVFIFAADNTQISQELPFIFGLPWTVFSVCHVIVMAYALFAVITETDKKLRIVLLLLTLPGFIAGASWLPILLIVAMTHRSADIWLKTGFVTGVSCLFVTMLLALNGVITIMGHGADRFAFGMVNRTNFAFAVLFFMIAYIVIRNGKLKPYEYTFLYLVIIAVFHLVEAKNATVCMFLFVTMCVIGQICDLTGITKKASFFFKGVQKYFLDYSFILALIVFFAAVKNRESIRSMESDYPWLHSFMIRLDTNAKLLADQFSLFGRSIAENGDFQSSKYFVVDSFYARALVMNGIIFFIVIMALFTFYMISARRTGNRTVYFALMIMALFAITDPGITDISLNFLAVLPLATWTHPDS